MEEFIANPSFGALQRLTKDILIEVGETRQLNVNRSQRKAELIGIIAEDFVDNGIFEENLLDNLPISGRHTTATQVDPETRLRLELQHKVELEKNQNAVPSGS